MTQAKYFQIAYIQKPNKVSINDKIELENMQYKITSIKEEKNFYKCGVKRLNKIAVLTPVLTPYDGIGQLTHFKAKQFSENNDVTVFCFNKEGKFDNE